jgi:hypothetical protein
VTDKGTGHNPGVAAKSGGECETAKLHATLYYRLVPRRLRRYFAVYWVVVGILSFLSQYLLWYLGDGKGLAKPLVCLSVFLVAVPLMFSLLHRATFRALSKLRPYFWGDSAEYEDWITDFNLKAFTLRSWLARVVAAAVFLGGIGTVVWLSRRCEKPWLAAISIAIFAVFMFVGSTTPYMVVGGLAYLSRLRNNKSYFEFFSLPHHALTGFFRAATNVNFAVISGYVLALMSVYFSPFTIDSFLRWWLMFWAVVPIFLLIWTFSFTHSLQHSIKMLQARRVGLLIQDAVRRVEEAATPEEVAKLDALVHIQERVQAMKEWPIGARFVWSLALALAPLTVQLVKALV